jgi:enoyl-CoA hydratase
MSIDMSIDVSMYSQFKQMNFTRPHDGVLLVTMSRPEVYNAADGPMHRDMSLIWPVISQDPLTRVCVITGEGRAFSAGGDLNTMHEQIDNYPMVVGQILKEAAGIVYGILNCEKVIVSAINGPAVGAGLACALMADISVAAKHAKMSDGHLKLGLAAGDHAPIIWPLLCGMAKSKYYLLTSRFVTGEEAERIGLVSMAVDAEEVLGTALDIAVDLANGPQDAIRFTKYALNNWLRQAGPIFDAALALEMLNLFSPDVSEGLRAMKAKEKPSFPTVTARWATGA